MTTERNDSLPQPNRREVMIQGIATMLAAAGFWSRSGIVLASVPGVTHGETPGLEEGPFWVDGQPNRSDVRPDTSTGTVPAGIPLYLGLTVSQLSDTAPYTIAPLVGAGVDIWNCNAQGVYSDETSEDTPGENYNRGYQLTSAHGTVEFITIYPGWYSGRTPHVHIRIRTYDSTGAVAYNWCTQLFFDETVTAEVFATPAYVSRAAARDTVNATDRVFTGASENGSPEADAGDYTLLTLAEDGTHVVGQFHMVLDLLDTANEDPTGGTETGGAGGTGGGTPPAGGTPPTGGAPPAGGTPPTGATGATTGTPPTATTTSTTTGTTASAATTALTTTSAATTARATAAAKASAARAAKAARASAAKAAKAARAARAKKTR